MTNIITRYFETPAAARAAEYELVYRQRVSRRILALYDSSEGLADKLTAAHVRPETAKAYQDKMASGGAVLLVRAGYKPLGVAKIARQAMAAEGAVDMGSFVEEVIVKDELNTKTSILTDHPRFLTRDIDYSGSTFHMANWPIPLISRRKPFTPSVVPPHARMANYFLPLISRRKPFTGSIIPRHGRMANFILPLLSDRKPYTASIFEPHARMANFPIPLISQRKPYTGSLIGKHPRMANWPFPHLINGKRGTNALVPGGARMANFPIGLLSDRKPFTGSIIPRHGRMAAFPLPLVSRRAPFQRPSASRHGPVTGAFFPLIFSRGGHLRKTAFARSLSEFAGIPTIIRR